MLVRTLGAAFMTARLRFVLGVAASILVGFPTLSFALDTQPAAVSVKPALNKPICLKREYSDDELRDEPKRRLSTIYVLLTRSKKHVNGDRFMLNEAEVYGESDGEIYVNREAICNFEPNGKTSCFVECDGGSFDLQPERQTARFAIGEQTFFPLYLQGVSRRKATSAQTVKLEANDRYNNQYRLYPAPLNECKAVRKRVAQVKNEC